MKSTEKVDLYKLHKHEYVALTRPALVTIKDARYLAVSGRGAPGGESFTEKIGALYAVAFTIKMTRKFAGQQDYVIGKLEGQWWCGDRQEDFVHVPQDQWCWKLLIRTPDFVGQDEVDRAVAVLLKRGKSPKVQEVRLESLAEGLCAQMLHVGPYEREQETIAAMQAHAEEKGLQFHGQHHEIYLSDPRRVPPERLRTILRRAVTKTPAA